MLVPNFLTSASKTPRVHSEVRYAQGNGSGNIGLQPVMLVGYKAAADVVAADYEIIDVVDPVEAATRVGRQSQLGRMILSSFMPGAYIRAIAIPPPAAGGSNVAAALDIIFDGTATGPGFVEIHIGGVVRTVSIATGNTATEVGDEVEAVINAIQDIFCTASNAAGTVTATCLELGATGNQHVVFIDTSRMAPGMTCTLDGGTAFASGGVPFTGGVGVTAIDATLIALENVDIAYSAWAHNDATSVAAVTTYAYGKASPLGVGAENTIFATIEEAVNTANDTSAASNQYFGQVIWAGANRWHPSQIAAKIAVYRSLVESAPATVLGDPNHRYLKEVVPGIPAHFKPEHSPRSSVTDVALNTGLTPLVTVNGQMAILRSITSYHTNGSQPDHRVLDTSDALVPQRVRKDIDAIWTNEFASANQYVGPDLPGGEAPPEGLATPNGWAGRINSRMKLDYFPANLVMQFDPNTGEELKAKVSYNTVLKCLISDVPALVTPKNFILGNVVRQIPA